MKETRTICDFCGRIADGHTFRIDGNNVFIGDICVGCIDVVTGKKQRATRTNFVHGISESVTQYIRHNPDKSSSEICDDLQNTVPTSQKNVRQAIRVVLNRLSNIGIITKDKGTFRLACHEKQHGRKF
jgi:hypothetical protein